MKQESIEISRSGNHTVYIRLPGNTNELGKTIRIESLIPNYSGPMVNFDISRSGTLVGIEVILFGQGEVGAAE